MKFDLLSYSNPKTMKSLDEGYVTFVLHLAPANVSGYETCPKSTEGCRASCLNLAGRGGMFAKGSDTNVVQEARKRKTRLFFENRERFMNLLVNDIGRAIVYARQNNLTAVFRLNGTSDIAWEKIRVGYHRNVMALFPFVQFYDYTKVPGRKTPMNYHLTFSAADGNDSDVGVALASGMNVAVVFDMKKSDPLPETYLGRPVVDGDKNDLRFLDPRGSIIGLHMKGTNVMKEIARVSGFSKNPDIVLKLAA